MQNQKESCKDLISRWRELRAKLPRAQRIIPGKSFEPSYISQEERDELNEMTKKIKNECLDSEFLAPNEKDDIKYSNIC